MTKARDLADGKIDTSTLVVDAANNRVGIGTTSPALPFEVNGSTNVAVFRSDASNSIIQLANSTGTGGDNGTLVGSVGDDLYLRAGDAERVRIDSSGSVGIGTNAPTTYGDSNTKLAVVTPTSNANDVNIRFGTNDVKGIIFVNDASGDGVGFGTTTNDHLQFNTNNTERMRIDSGGNVLVGTTSASGSPGLTIRTDGNGRYFQHKVTYNGFGVDRFYQNNSEVGNIIINASSVSYNTTSDHRLKENVADMTGAIDRVKTLAPKRFNFIADADNTVDGFLAHEAQAVVPEAVYGTHNEVDDDGNAVMQGIDQSKLVPLLTGALKEAIAKIEALEARVTALEDA